MEQGLALVQEKAEERGKVEGMERGSELEQAPVSVLVQVLAQVQE